MSATVPDDLPACQRKGFVYKLKDVSRETWASIAATLAGAILVTLAAYWTGGCGPNVVLVLLDNGRVVECP
jgi:hypothetical protein